MEEVKWEFILPSPPHYGGVWERLIKSLKKILQLLFHEQTLDDEGLSTVFCEVEAIMNDRPLITVSNVSNDLEPLTPNHLLHMKHNLVIRPGIFEKSDTYLRRRWKQVQHISNLLWKWWIREYPPSIQEQMRTKWTSTKRNFQPNDLVIIVDEKAPRNSWLLGRIVKTFPDSQGIVRNALIKTKSSTLLRPIHKLC